MTDNLPIKYFMELALTDSISFAYGGESYLIENNKLYNSKHKVAVVYSPGYGGGWTTWGYNVDPTDARVALLALTGAEATLTLQYYDGYVRVHFVNRSFMNEYSSLDNDLAIKWLPAGTLYKIEEYDGAESVVVNHDTDWHIT